MTLANFDNVTLYNGDSLAILSSLPSDSVDAVLTDPPYSSGGATLSAKQADPANKYQQTGTRRQYPPMLGDAKDQRSFITWATLWMGECWRVSKAGSPLLLFSDWRQLPAMTDAVQAAGWTWRNLATWHKPGVRMQRGRFSGSAEYIIYGSRGVPKSGERSPQNVLKFQPVMGGDKEHIAEKPVELLRELIGVTPPGAIILDPFAGSGTTGRAAKDLGRKAVLIEREERYCEIAARRMQQEVLAL